MTVCPPNILRTKYKDNTRVQFNANPEAYDNLNAIRDAYADLLGRPVAASVIVRRAFPLLLAHLESLDTEQSKINEVAAVYRAVQ